MSAKRVRVLGFSEPEVGTRHEEDVSLGDHFFPALVANVGFSDTELMGHIRRTSITVTNLAVAMVDATTSGSQGTQKILDFPLGVIKVEGASFNLTTARVGTNLQATAALIGSIGSAVAAVDVTLTGTEADVIPSTAGTLAAGLGAFKAGATAVAFLDGSAAAKSLYLNVDCPDAGSAGNDTLTVNGTIEIFWMHLGNGN